MGMMLKNLVHPYIQSTTVLCDIVPLTIDHCVHVQYTTVVSMTTIYVSQAIHCIVIVSAYILTVTMCKTMKLCTNTYTVVTVVMVTRNMLILLASFPD